MAIVECPKCNEKIMSWHPDFPYCGKVLKRNYSKLISALVVLGVAGGGFYAGGRMDIKEITKQITQYINEIKLSDINGMLIFNPVILITIAVVVILLYHQIVCWYFKQNEQVALLKEIRVLLKGSIQEQASSKKQTKAPVKQEVQNHNPTAEGSRAEDFSTKQEWLAWLFDQPIDNLTENNLKELISVTKRAGQYEKCKAYLECIITKYPDSAYIKFIAKDRLKEMSAKLGQEKLKKF